MLADHIQDAPQITGLRIPNSLADRLTTEQALRTWGTRSHRLTLDGEYLGDWVITSLLAGWDPNTREMVCVVDMRRTT